MDCPNCNTEYKKENIEFNFNRDTTKGPIDIDFHCEACEQNYYAAIRKDQLTYT